MLFLEFFCTECTDKFSEMPVASSMASISSEAVWGLGRASAVEVEVHEVYVSAPKWRLLFLGVDATIRAYNYYMYTERSSSGIQLPYSMYRRQIRP